MGERDIPPLSLSGDEDPELRDMDELIAIERARPFDPSHRRGRSDILIAGAVLVLFGLGFVAAWFAGAF